MRHVLFYETAEDGLAKAPENFPAHQERFMRYAADGTLVGIGTFGDPQTEGAMAIFTTREAAEDFARDDPFVVNGVVGKWHVREWDDVLSPDT